MTRETAKIWMSIPRETIKIIAPNIDKHFNILCAYANGAEIQYKSEDQEEWKESAPLFDEYLEYRVKPSKDEEQPKEPWKPKKGDSYFIVDEFGEVCEIEFKNYETDDKHFDFDNCFRTYEEAEAALERVRSALKRETLSKSETVESLDGQELSYYEKNLIRLLRNVKIEEVYQFYSVFNKQGGGISFKVDDEECREEFYQTLTALAEKKPYLPIIG